MRLCLVRCSGPLKLSRAQREPYPDCLRECEAEERRRVLSDDSLSNGIKTPNAEEKRRAFARISEIRFADRVFLGSLTGKRRRAARITEALSAQPAGLEFLRKLVFSKLLLKRDSVELNALDLYWKIITFPELP